MKSAKHIHTLKIIRTEIWNYSKEEVVFLPCEWYKTSQRTLHKSEYFYTEVLALRYSVLYRTDIANKSIQNAGWSSCIYGDSSS
jgi:hypothetical protein